MPRKPKSIDTDIDIENIYENDEIQDLLDDYTSSVYSKYPKSEYYYDSDSYGYDDGYDR